MADSLLSTSSNLSTLPVPDWVPAAAPILFWACSLLLVTVLFMLWRLRQTKTERARYRQEVMRLDAELRAQERINEDRNETFQLAQQQVQQNFRALSAEALRQNNQEFLRLAQSSLRQLQESNELDHARREEAIGSLVKPIREALEKTEKETRRMEEQRREAHGDLSRHLQQLNESQRALQSETRNLVGALRRPEIRGQWGETTLKRLVEMAGMVEHCDFQEQAQVDTEQGRLRPDMLIHLPDKRLLVVDVKTPLDAYLSAMEADNDKHREAHLQTHCRNVRKRIKELADKAYWAQFDQSPDFVILFIPGEQFLSVALDRDPHLLDEAMRSRIILTTPMSLIATLRAVAFSWRQLAIVRHAEEIRKLGDTLLHRLGTFTEHLSGVGKGLSNGVDAYNRAVGSLDRQVLVSARRLSELGIQASKELTELDSIDTTVRNPTQRKDSENPSP